MPDRVPSDHPSVETVRATLARAGRTDRPKVALPDDADSKLFPADELVRLALAGRPSGSASRNPRHAYIERALDDNLEFRGAYATRSMARDGPANTNEDENLLVAWADDVGLDLGRSVLVDIVEPGFFYGLRKPGTDAVYEVPERPDAGLADIARRVEEESGDDD